MRRSSLLTGPLTCSAEPLEAMCPINLRDSGRLTCLGIHGCELGTVCSHGSIRTQRGLATALGLANMGLALVEYMMKLDITDVPGVVGKTTRAAVESRCSDLAAVCPHLRRLLYLTELQVMGIVAESSRVSHTQSEMLTMITQAWPESYRVTFDEEVRGGAVAAC